MGLIGGRVAIKPLPMFGGSPPGPSSDAPVMLVVTEALCGTVWAAVPYAADRRGRSRVSRGPLVEVCVPPLFYGGKGHQLHMTCRPW